MVENGVCAVVVTFRPPVCGSGQSGQNAFSGPGLGRGGQRFVPRSACADGRGEPRTRFRTDREWRQSWDRRGSQHRSQVGQVTRIQWVALFDQDSTLERRLHRAMLAEYETNPLREKIAIVTPKHLELETGEWDRPAFAEDGTPLIAITSGSLMPVRYLRPLRMVRRRPDHRQRRRRVLPAGEVDGLHASHCAKRRHLHHSVGSPRMHSFLGLFMVKATHHGAKRHYYMTRNRIVIMKKICAAIS